ncbi:MAG: phosphomannomutase/phosphoglucomutase [Patescibacteria group bacterium]|jgi:phosphomannomutase
MSFNPAIFRTDFRGVYPTEVNADSHERLARAFATFFHPKTVAVGMDVRLSGPELKQAVITGLTKSGVNVVDIGMIGTDMSYFASAAYDFDASLIVTASHNPAEYNGLKFALKGGAAFTRDNGVNEVCDLAVKNQFADAPVAGTVTQKDIMEDYLNKCLSFVDISKLKPLRIALNPNFGSVCYSYKKLLEKVKFEPVPLNAEPDGNFPKGRPDPLRPETRQETIDLIKKSDVSFGVAWDADGDRCFFYDELGDFVDGYYIVGILARYFLELYPKSPIPYDIRQWWATVDVIKEMGGEPVMAKVGNIYLRSKVREHNAPYGGEMSAHHYFRDFYYCDNGFIPFLIIWQMVSEGKKLSELAKPFREKYFISGEINFTVKDQKAVLQKVESQYGQYKLDHFDGLSVDNDREWRFNVRGSNNEPLLRINVEAKSQELVDQKVKELETLINS